MTAAARIRALTEAATPREWNAMTGRQDGAAEVYASSEHSPIIGCRFPPDAALIVALRNAAEEIADLIEVQYFNGVCVICGVDSTSAPHYPGCQVAAVEARFPETA